MKKVILHGLLGHKQKDSDTVGVRDREHGWTS